MSPTFCFIHSKNKIFAFLLLILLFSPAGLAKDYQKIDSLLSELNKSAHDTLIIKTA